MSRRESGGLFPLPLTPLEYYYFCDNRPDYPTAFPAQLHFSGRLDRDGFQRALAGAWPVTPCSRLASGRWPAAFPRGPRATGTRRRWTGALWASRSGMATGRRSICELRRGCGSGFVESDDASRLFLQFHHACCDGWASLQFIEDLLVAYHVQIEGPRCGATLRPLDPALLRDRGRLEVQPSWWAQFRDLWVAARLWSGLAFREPALLAPGRPGPAEADLPLLDFQTVNASSELIGGLRQGGGCVRRHAA